MVYTAQIGDVGDALYREQTANALAGNVLIDGCSVALGGSTTSIKTQVEPGVLKIGNDYPAVSGGPVTHPDGDPDHPRLDTITADSNGDVGRIVGQPMPADPPNRHYPNIRTPAPPVPNSPGVVALAVLEVPAGAGSSAELFDDYMTPHEIMGDGLNDLQLIPGRDLQYVIDNAREGQTLRGDRSQTIVLDQPLTIGTKNVTLTDLTLQFGENVARNTDDNMLTLAADGVTVKNTTLDGHRFAQSGNADGVTIRASECAVKNVIGRDMPASIINVDGRNSTVENTTVENVIGSDSDNDAIVIQGAGVSRTSVSTIRAARCDTTLGLENGPFRTSAMDLYGKDQDSVVRFDDSGGNSPAIVRADIRFVVGNGTNRLIHNETTSGVAHRGFIFSRLGGGGFKPAALGGVGAGIVDLSNLSGVKLTDSFLSDEFTDAYSIYATNGYEISLSNLTLQNAATNRGCIGLFGTRQINIRNSICRDSPGRGVFITAGGVDNIGRYQVLNNVFESISDEAIFIKDNPQTSTDNVIVKNNFGEPITVNVDGQHVIKKDNIPIQ